MVVVIRNANQLLNVDYETLSLESNIKKMKVARRITKCEFFLK